MLLWADSADLSGKRQPCSPEPSSLHTPGGQRGIGTGTLPGLRSLRVPGPGPSGAGVAVAREGKGLAEGVASMEPSSSPTWLARRSPPSENPQGLLLRPVPPVQTVVWLLHPVGAAWAEAS